MGTAARATTAARSARSGVDPRTTPKTSTRPPRQTRPQETTQRITRPTITTVTRQKYKMTKQKYCKNQNEIFESKDNEIKTAGDCLNMCTENKRCISAEWYEDNPTKCDLSSSCKLSDVQDA